MIHFYFAERKTVFIFADMKAKKDSTNERNDAIRKRFEKLDSKNMYRPYYIYNLLAKEFYLSRITIENIVFNRV